MATQKKPATVFRSGSVKAAVWENAGAKGPFFSATFSRPYKDVEGKWRNTSNFGLFELEALMNVALEAREWVLTHPPQP